MTNEPLSELYDKSYEEELLEVRKALECLSEEIPIKKLENEQKNLITKKLKDYDALKGYHSVSILDGVILDNSDSILLVISIEFFITSTSSSGQTNQTRHIEFVFGGITKLNRKYGKTIIRPETLEDKIVEFFNSKEVDFASNKSFSKNYFVLTDDEINLRRTVDDHFMNAINRHKNFFIETNGEDLFVRIKQKASKETALNIAELLLELSKK